MDEQRVALVTGANRGIGREIARQLLSRGLQVIITCRDRAKGETTAEELAAAGDGKPLFFPLDVTHEPSVAEAGEFVQRRCGRLDVLVNNAGVLVDRNTTSITELRLDVLRSTLETNVYGVLRVTQALLGLMRPRNYGRIVNLSSGLGQLSEMQAGTPAYRISKTALNAVTRILAAELRGTNIKVNSMCPGWVRTDMGGPNALRSVEEGADTALWLATLPEDGPTGGFFRDRLPIPW